MQKNYRQGGVMALDALPGTYLVHAYFDDNQVDLVRCNVLGWQIAADRTVTPIVVDPRAADELPWTVIHPDGRVERSDGRCWDSEDAWLTHQRREQRLAA
jgi:hypothetical protein